MYHNTFVIESRYDESALQTAPTSMFPYRPRYFARENVSTLLRLLRLVVTVRGKETSS